MTRFGSIVRLWTTEPKSLATVKRGVLSLKADYVEIVDPNGTKWSRKSNETRWTKTGPLSSMGEIQAQMSKIQAEYRLLDEKLDAFRVCCPTCNCKILPQEVCQCCVGKDLLAHILGTGPDAVAKVRDSRGDKPN